MLLERYFRMLPVKMSEENAKTVVIESHSFGGDAGFFLPTVCHLCFTAHQTTTLHRDS